MAGEQQMGAETQDAQTGARRVPAPLVLAVIGLVLCLAPLASDLWQRYQSSQAVSSMTDIASTMDPALKAELLAQAQTYNARMGGYDAGTGIDNASIWDYERQLSVNGDTAMAWVEIPRALVSLTVYHGDDDAALSQGVGHLEATSLPVGGENASVWLEGHSGSRTASLFDNIRVLEAGDVFAVHTLGDTYAYRVTSWEIVDPADVTSQTVAPAGSDEATLVTCTTAPDDFNPKGRTGVNDKRLLVHAQRTEYDPAEFAQAQRSALADPQVLFNEHTLQAALAALLIAAAVAATLVRKRKKAKEASTLAQQD